MATAIVLMTFISLLSMISPAEQAFVDPDAYALLEGVLHDDTYELYPYEKKSLRIGFSKYGEMIARDACPVCDNIGINYDMGPDPFANENVSINEWNEGWLMNITYDYEGASESVWAYAVFSDFRGTEGEWITNATSPTDDRPGYRGGRKTNGYAETDEMEILYDGPRRAIVLLTTRIYDPDIPNPTDPDDPKGLPLVVLYIQVVFNKVKKYVVLIKDIKLTTESKLLEKVQVKFGQRGEWDLGWEPEPFMPRSYAHYYHALPTKYFKHPWYYTSGLSTGYDLVQIIDQEQNFAAFAAHWPEPMGWRVESIAELTRRDKLTDLADWEHRWDGEEGTYDGHYYLYYTSMPGYYQSSRHMGPNSINDGDYGLSYPDCDFPPSWSNAEPEVYVDGVKQTYEVDYYWIWDPGTPGGEDRMSPGATAEEIAGDFTLQLIGYPGDGADIYVHWKLHAEQDDMTDEPRTPYTFAEWVFDLSYDDEELPTQQFRLATVYGVTDLNDGDDADIGEDHDNVIDSEIMYQLNEVFNPWDLRQAVGAWSWADYGDVFDAKNYHERDMWPGKWTERWVEFYTGDGVEDEFWLPEQIVVPDEWAFPDWDEYCTAREKVLVDGVLQEPGDDYELTWTRNITETLAEGPMDIESGDSFQLMYPRIVSGSDTVNTTIDDVTTTLRPGIDYDLDTSNGKLYIWKDDPPIELQEDDELVIDYALFFPATYLDFYEESVPDEDAHIKVLYSTFRIVYKVDKFIWGIDGWWTEDSDIIDFSYPEENRRLYLRFGPVLWFDFVDFTYENWITVLVNGKPAPMGWEWNPMSQMRYGIDAIWIEEMELGMDDVIEVIYPIFAGRYEWTILGTDTGPADPAGASMVSEGLRQWKNFDTKISGLDYMRHQTPELPYLFRNISGPGDDRDNYYDDVLPQVNVAGNGRPHFRDDWCTTLPVASSNVIVIGGPTVNIAAEYFNDFTDVYVNRIGASITKFTSHGCWNRNSYVNTGDLGYALISTYKDLNGTIGFIVWGYSGSDTYYASYALQHGLLEIMQWLQPGVTSLLLEFDYSKHPSDDCFFHVVESLGTITECSGFEYESMWEIDMMDGHDGEMIYKLVMNSYSSEYWVFHTYVDYDTVKPWHLPYTTAISVIYPQYIYFHWEPKIHPDP
ncbi:MAG: hypothetical protein JSV57_05060 [Candidatus Bathyarchaeota archaeon]|nr:MAG: hypothetical protein JSV57_05060 [Candidatus Bathyarchaeota archaeon]